MEMKLALQVDKKDNVATIFANDIKDGTVVQIKNQAGEVSEVQVIGDVPFGHKISVTDISKGSPVMKYGESIGRTSADIRRGEYVHIHNMEAMRGRGDL